MNKLDVGKQNEQQLQKWKTIDYIAVPIKWETSSIVARNCTAHNLTDHWPVMTYVRLLEKKGWLFENNSALKGMGQKVMKMDFKE